MAHVREQLVSRANTLLLGSGFTGLVTINRATPWGDTELPSANVVWEDDQLEDTIYGNSPSAEIWTRIGSMVIEVRAKEAGGLVVWITLNDAAEEIEKVLVQDAYTSIGLPIQGMAYAESEFATVGEADQDTGLLRMVYAMRYKYSSLDPSTLIP